MTIALSRGFAMALRRTLTSSSLKCLGKRLGIRKVDPLSPDWVFLFPPHGGGSDKKPGCKLNGN
jgi:hypothetical protein